MVNIVCIFFIKIKMDFNIIVLKVHVVFSVAGTTYIWHFKTCFSKWGREQMFIGNKY